MKNIILLHAAMHPSMTPQDVLKLCYQATFGAEHLLADKARAYQYFMNEWATVSPADTALTEEISERYMRIHLGAWKRRGIAPEWLFRIFFMTAGTPSHADRSDLIRHHDQVAQLAEQGHLPFSLTCWQEALTAYWENGGGAVHHSEAYRAAELPAYRVVDKRFCPLIPVLERLAALTPADGQPLTVAIDGRAASGKSTLAQMLSEVLDAGIVHMDDFFLPPELRTPERLSGPGGNVHYERFAEQVLPYLKLNGAFDYPVFDCSKMQTDGVREVKGSAWRIVEGSYSHHPKIPDYADLRLFCTVSPEEQMRRILLRNGERMAAMFAERWIPMEENYFNTYHIRESADMIIDTEAKENDNEADI